MKRSGAMAENTPNSGATAETLRKPGAMTEAIVDVESSWDKERPKRHALSALQEGMLEGLSVFFF